MGRVHLAVAEKGGIGDKCVVSWTRPDQSDPAHVNIMMMRFFDASLSDTAVFALHRAALRVHLKPVEVPDHKYQPQPQFDSPLRPASQRLCVEMVLIEIGLYAFTQKFNDVLGVATIADLYGVVASDLDSIGIGPVKQRRFQDKVKHLQLATKR